MTPSPAPTPDNGEQVGINDTLTQPISADGVAQPDTLYTVPARQGRAVRLNAGQVIRIINTHGTQVCDTWAFKADDLSEFMSMEHARAWIDRITPRVGDPLVTNRRVKDYHDNCADNMRMALKAIGLRAREVPQPFNVWMNIPVAPDGSIQWLAPASKAGDYIDLKAEMDCVVVMSACPQDIIPINDNRPVEVQFTVVDHV